MTYLWLDESGSIDPLTDQERKEAEEKLRKVIEETDAEREAHAEAFKLIENPNDWRAPIDALIPGEDYDRCAAACIFFTSTELVARGTVDTEDGPMLSVTAIGYREGPAGP